MALVKSEEVLVYEPTFDENTGIYTDDCPYKRHERNRSTYKCGCDHSFRFFTTAQFKSHIKSNKHKEFVKDYKYNKRSDKETRRELKECRIKLELSERKVRTIVEKDVKLIKEITKLRDENKLVKKKRESLRRSVKELHIENKNKNEEIESLTSQLLKSKEYAQYLELKVIMMEDSEFKEVIDHQETT